MFHDPQTAGRIGQLFGGLQTLTEHAGRFTVYTIDLGTVDFAQAQSLLQRLPGDARLGGIELLGQVDLQSMIQTLSQSHQVTGNAPYRFNCISPDGGFLIGWEEEFNRTASTTTGRDDVAVYVHPFPRETADASEIKLLSDETLLVFPFFH